MKNLSIKLNNINEGFEDVFDSSLVDYSNDFEKSDERYKKICKIKDWIEEHVELYFMYNPSKPINIHDTYIINEDYTIDLIKNYTYIITRSIKNNDRKSPLIDGKLPEFIRFNKCKGDFVFDGFIELKSLEGSPNIVEGNFEATRGFLSSLKGGPAYVKGDYNVADQISIELAKVFSSAGSFPLSWLSNKKMLQEKYGFPDYIGGTFIFSDFTGSRLKCSSNMYNYTDMNEGFENAFDSSLMDYSSDFKEQDNNYRINQIWDWLKKNIIITGNKGIGLKVYNPFESEESKQNKGWKAFFKINDDYTVDIIRPESISHIIYTEFGAELYPINWTKNAGKIILLFFEKNSGELKEIPSYIKFNKCEGCFRVNDFPNLISLNGFPTYVFGRVVIGNTSIKTLEGGPVIVRNSFNLNDNHNLCSFKGAPCQCKGGFWWNDGYKDTCPAIDAVHPRYKDGVLINANEL